MKHSLKSRKQIQENHTSQNQLKKSNVALDLVLIYINVKQIIQINGSKFLFPFCITTENIFEWKKKINYSYYK